MDSQTVDALSARHNEPAWLRERRQAGFEAFQRFPMPTRQDEDYRRSDLRRLNLGEFAMPHANGKGAAAPEPIGKTGGQMVQIDGTVAQTHLADELASQGVVFCSLSEAVQKHEELVRPYLTDERIGADEDKWSAMNSAFWTGGSFLYVPPNVSVELPLRSSFVHNAAGAAQFARTLVVADEWSSVAYVDDYLSTGDIPGFNAGVVDVVAKEGAAVRYYHLQNWSQQLWNFTRERFFGGRDSALNLLQVALGSRLTKAYVHAHLENPGVNAELLGLVFIGGNQHVDHSTLQNHIQGQTLSDLLFKCAVLENARSVYGGLIAIHPNAQRSDAYQNNRNLLLSTTARADSIPMLEILANDVRCTHGSTTSSVDEEEVFYLQSRGIPRAQAERLIVEGFFANVLERIPLESVRERLEHAIDQKVSKLVFA